MAARRQIFVWRVIPMICLVTLVFTASASPTASTASNFQGSCPSPPVEASTVSNDGDRLPELEGTEALIMLPDVASLDAPLDTDGDGLGDLRLTQDEPGDPAGLERGQGRIVLEREGLQVGISQQIGDLDGDGRDDIAAIARPTADAYGAEVESFVVSGATPNGVHQLTDVGVRLSPGLIQPAGDLDGDGRPDVIVSVGHGEPSSLRSSLFSGTAVGAMRPGADARDAAAQSLPGELVGVARMNGQATLITAVPIENAEGNRIAAVVLLDLGGRSFELTTVPEPWASNGSGVSSGRLVGVHSLTVTPTGTFLTATQHPGSRGNAQSQQMYRWRLDEPCAHGSVGGAPPAGSRPGTVTLTG